eukprot:TRINITY_DN4477_c0_g1_i7.p1 TRINITY_DN4477_c0_g1~~TRINITY_DN4477_c0_g1_i7.p1  ORF type:complete len:368 (+),score=27.83 TRINITY_DN4477_c0_g1_i7:102-1205(+)
MPEQRSFNLFPLLDRRIDGPEAVTLSLRGTFLDQPEDDDLGQYRLRRANSDGSLNATRSSDSVVFWLPGVSREGSANRTSSSQEKEDFYDNGPGASDSNHTMRHPAAGLHHEDLHQNPVPTDQQSRQHGLWQHPQQTHSIRHSEEMFEHRHQQATSDLPDVGYQQDTAPFSGGKTGKDWHRVPEGWFGGGYSQAAHMSSGSEASFMGPGKGHNSIGGFTQYTSASGPAGSAETVEVQNPALGYSKDFPQIMAGAPGTGSGPQSAAPSRPPDAEGSRITYKDLDDETLLSLVPINTEGEPSSVGSFKHPGSCSPCNFWFKGLCSKGVRCTYCHFRHEGQKSKRIRPSKNTRLWKRSLLNSDGQGMADP